MIDLTLYSDADVGNWKLQALDLTQVPSAMGLAEFTYTLDKTAGRSGDTVHLTITGQIAATKGHGFMIYSSRSATDWNAFPVWVRDTMRWAALREATVAVETTSGSSAEPRAVQR